MNKKMTTPYMDIINTIKRVVTKENIKLVENKFTKRGLSSSFVHISKTCLENSEEFQELKKMDKFKNIEYNINFYPSMFNDKYGVQYLSKNNKINIYLD
jgi:hypothetical protein